jgi:hypothetical protein
MVPTTMLTPLLLLATFTAVQGQQGSCNINRLVAPLNAACCPNARSCSGGIPTVCTTACRTAWTDFSESPCRAQVLSTTGTDASSMRLASIFTSVGQLCGRSDGRPGAGGVCPSLDAPAGTTGECRDTNLGATCDFACGGDQTGHRRAQTGGVATFSCGPGRGGPEWTQTASCADGAVAAVGLDPSDSTQFIMNNGQTMPVVSFGFEIYGNDEASELMGIALDAGVRNFFASVLASNQPGVGSKINTMEREHGVTREEIFLCGSVTQCRTNLVDDARCQHTARTQAQPATGRETQSKRAAREEAQPARPQSSSQTQRASPRGGTAGQTQRDTQRVAQEEAQPARHNERRERASPRAGRPPDTERHRDTEQRHRESKPMTKHSQTHTPTQHQEAAPQRTRNPQETGGKRPHPNRTPTHTNQNPHTEDTTNTHTHAPNQAQTRTDKDRRRAPERNE